MPGKLYLIPAPIADTAARPIIPAATQQVVNELTYFLAENVRTARRYIAALLPGCEVEKLRFETLHPHTASEKMEELLRPVFQGQSAGVLSESGCPGVADPGAEVVAFAHAKGVEVVPLVGPSSIVMALMGSGLNGQKFCFNGYLPVKQPALARAIKELERESAASKCTQICIETPYRNNRLFGLLLQHLLPSTRLCVALDLTGSRQQIMTRTVAGWKKQQLTWPKLPAIFLFQA
jgi:16S rRNA (cytidine1402-2'-O)-methyltransferase